MTPYTTDHALVPVPPPHLDPRRAPSRVEGLASDEGGAVWTAHRRLVDAQRHPLRLGHRLQQDGPRPRPRPRHSRAPTGSGNHTSRRAERRLVCRHAPPYHSSARPWRVRRNASMQAGPAAPVPGDVDLVGPVDRVRRVPGQDVAEPGTSPQPTTSMAPARRASASSARSAPSRRRCRPRPRPVLRRAARPAGPFEVGTGHGNGDRDRRRSPRGPHRHRPRATAPARPIDRGVRDPGARTSSRPVTSNRSRPGVSSSWRAARIATSPVPTRNTEVTGGRAPRAPAIRRKSTARSPWRAAAPRCPRRSPSRQRGGHGGTSSS